MEGTPWEGSAWGSPSEIFLYKNIWPGSPGSSHTIGGDYVVGYGGEEVVVGF